MSAPETPVTTEAVQILELQKAQAERMDQLIAAINGLGQNVQWIIDNVQGIFQVFQSPQFMAQLPAMMGGMQSGGQAADGPSGD